MTTAARRDRFERTTKPRRSLARRAASRVIRIPEREVDFDVRGFAPCDRAVRELLELHGLSFATGFNAAVAVPYEELGPRLEEVPQAERGFAFEGAGMALALLDLLVPGRRRRIATFAGGIGSPHVYMVHVGAGWALARLRRRPWGRLTLDPLLRWLALDGYGFHEAFFRPAETVRAAKQPARLRGYELRGFDQGVGRALWFVEAASAERIARAIGDFPPQRRADLWSGAGLAATYAGGASTETLEAIRELAGTLSGHVAQGAAFAAGARARAGNVVPHNETAARILCGLDVQAAAALTDRTRPAADEGGAEDYERWRTAIRTELSSVAVPA